LIREFQGNDKIKIVEKVILVNELDEELGVMEKMQAHSLGLLHRAFSVFIFNEKNELLIQQRAKSKYHSGGLWSNTCCSHPRQGEAVVDAAERRLVEEMGFTTKLTKTFDFIYRKALDKGLFEHEFDHVFVGEYNNRPVVNDAEVQAFEYVNVNKLLVQIDQEPHKYTEWFKISLPRVVSMINQ
jgi:isopentenyl-diphosphate delta-isomerase